jgi:hypothetical protein
MHGIVAIMTEMAVQPAFTLYEQEPVTIVPFPKIGAAADAEIAAQTVINSAAHPGAIDNAFTMLDGQLNDRYRGKSEVAEFKKAQRFRQAAITAAGFVILQTALPRMNNWYEQHLRTIIPDDVQLEPLIYGDAATRNAGYGGRMSLPERAYRTSHLLTDSSWKAFKAMEDESHPYHALLPHVRQALSRYQSAWNIWHEGAGKDRWPYFTILPKLGNKADTFLASIFATNVRLAVNLLASKAISHLIYHSNGGLLDAVQLAAVLRPSVPELLRHTTIDRHVTWEPDWREREINGENLDNTPLDGVKALLQQPAQKILDPNEYAASRGPHGSRVMQNSDFCPHPMIAEAPLENAASCGGTLNISFAEAAGQKQSRRFFGNMGFEPESGNKFCLAAVALAWGYRTIRREILPVYEHNMFKSLPATPVYRLPRPSLDYHRLEQQYTGSSSGGDGFPLDTAAQTTVDAPSYVGSASIR